MTIPNLSATFFKLFSGGVRQYQSHPSILYSNISIKCAKLSIVGKKKDEKFSGSGVEWHEIRLYWNRGLNTKERAGVPSRQSGSSSKIYVYERLTQFRNYLETYPTPIGIGYAIAVTNRTNTAVSVFYPSGGL